LATVFVERFPDFWIHDQKRVNAMMLLLLRLKPQGFEMLHDRRGLRGDAAPLPPLHVGLGGSSPMRKRRANFATELQNILRRGNRADGADEGNSRVKVLITLRVMGASSRKT
jgi:hypothetical protein